MKENAKTMFGLCCGPRIIPVHKQIGHAGFRGTLGSFCPMAGYFDYLCPNMGLSRPTDAQNGVVIKFG